MERIFGIGGGLVSRESEENLKKGQQLLQRKKPEQAMPFLMKAMEDPYNLDACVAVCMTMPWSLAIPILQQGEVKGREYLKRVVSPDCFEEGSESVGDFWLILETRPYMRLLGTLVRGYIHVGRWNEAAERNIEMLRLCRGDNMGQRQWMGAILLHAGRPSDALYFTQRWLGVDDTPKGSGIDFKPPSGEPLTQTMIDKISDFVSLQMIYSAALAAFTLFGDCELARQYLHIAARYPIVLIKVLGRFKERADVDTHPTRSMNGVEDARDHLWLAQDLWSEDRVYDWIDKDPVVESYVLRLCCNPPCGKKETKVAEWKKCAGCGGTFYCSRDCQKSHWTNGHKKPCNWQREWEKTNRLMWT